MLNVLNNGNSNSPEKLRKEPRFMTNGKGQATVIGVPTYGKYVATIVDVSRSGLQIELNTPLQKGAQVKVEFSDTIVIGEVLNMRSHGSGLYRMGVKISEVAVSHQPKRYQPEIGMSLHALDQVVSKRRRPGSQAQATSEAPLQVPDVACR